MRHAAWTGPRFHKSSTATALAGPQEKQVQAEEGGEHRAEAHQHPGKHSIISTVLWSLLNAIQPP